VHRAGELSRVARMAESTVATVDHDRYVQRVGLGVNTCASVTSTKGELVQEMAGALAVPARHKV